MFKTMTYDAKRKSIKRFVNCHVLLDRVKRHSGPSLLVKLEATKQEFTARVSRFIVEHSYEDCQVWNVDQTGVIYDMKPKKVVVERGTAKITDKNLESSQKTFRVTGYLTINASGEKLKPFLVFPAARGGNIEKKELPQLSSMARYTLQKSGWTDEIVMLDYINIVLKPLSQSRPGPHLILVDALSSHVSVRLKLEEINLKWIYILTAQCLSVNHWMWVSSGHSSSTYETNWNTSFITQSRPMN